MLKNDPQALIRAEMDAFLHWLLNSDYVHDLRAELEVYPEETDVYVEFRLPIRKKSERAGSEYQPIENCRNRNDFSGCGNFRLWSDGVAEDGRMPDLFYSPCNQPPVSSCMRFS